ncbi:MAG: M1 family aminopeptidase [Candidatus Sulfotelmatobacter sp.]
MKFRLFLLCALCVPVLNALALDREAFTFTNYDLTVRIEPEQQRLGVRGKIALRNDSSTPQKIGVLQISSSLGWRSIKAAGKQLQFVSQTYTSDIDHTGSLSEAIVTLPEAIPPKGSVELEIAYEGVIVIDATRLTRIGAPEAEAKTSDWDQISAKFTAVRGAGNVAWYPIATEDASLSEGASLSEILGRWKAREAGSTMRLQMSVLSGEGDAPELLVNATTCPTSQQGEHEFVADCSYRSMASIVPTFVIASYETVEHPSVSVHFLQGRASSAANYADAADKALPLIAEWFGNPKNKAQTADLPDANSSPFESGSLLLMPLTSIDPKLAGLMAAHQLTHSAFYSARLWINEGLAHFAQALQVEHQSGRKAALDYMRSHQSKAVTAATDDADPKELHHTPNETSQSLINTYDEQLYRGKAMSVWWMLRDMVGDAALKKAIADYRPEQDKEPSYMQRLIQAHTERDLEWFFDDWIYRDRGLPDFKVASAFTRKTLPEGYMLTITVGNSGTAGAEVPVTVKFEGGEVTQRLLVRSKSNTVIRVPVPKQPEEIVVNDGSVPESKTSNNTFKIEATDTAK